MSESQIEKENGILNTNTLTTSPVAKKTKRPMNMQKFYPSFLLVATFVIFLIVPDLTYLFYGIIAQNKSDTLFDACSLSFAFANFTDVIIYLYWQPRVKKQVQNIWRRNISGQTTTIDKDITTFSRQNHRFEYTVSHT